MLCYNLHTRGSWMTASTQEVSQVYQKTICTLLHTTRHTAHYQVQSFANELQREHWAAAKDVLEAVCQAVRCLSRKGKQPRSPCSRRVRRCTTSLESPCYILLTGHSATQRDATQLTGSP